MEKAVPRVILAGTNSGCGKTTVTCAILQALQNRKIPTGAFKCGPDYIDPMFHSRIIGTPSCNLDLFFYAENTLRYLLARNAQTVNIIEGVMGFYDGLGITSPEASTYHMAKATDSPVILVVDGKGLSLSVLAVIQGFCSLYPENHIQGVILNRCTPMTYGALAKAITEKFSGKVRPLGYLPPMPECTLQSRHLGLVTAQEVENLREMMGKLAEQAEKSLNLSGILELAQEAPVLSYTPVTFTPGRKKVRIGVAQDKAFCFYYGDNLRALKEMGAELVAFSPLEDESLPPRLGGLYLGGGYPELYGEALSRNTSMRTSIRQALSQGLPCIAECGGFMYLTEAIGDFPMVGYLPGHCYDTGKLARFGYAVLTAEKENMLCGAGEKIAAHEFHHWDCTDTGDTFRAEKKSGRSWQCGVSDSCLYAGFPHFHFYGNPRFCENFYRACEKESEKYD